MEKSFDIIIPVYNCAEKLPTMLNALLNQTYRNYKIILVDDGSKDETLAVCRHYAEMNEHISVLHQENRGPGAARKNGFMQADAEYVLFFDADDYTEKTLLEKVNRVLCDNDIDVLEYGFKKTDANGNQLSAVQLHDESVDGECFQHYIKQKNTTNFLWNKVFRRELIGEDDFVELFYSEDACLLTNVFAKCKRYRVISEALYYYVCSDESACGQKASVKRLDQVRANQYMLGIVQNTAPALTSYMACTACSQAAKLYGYFSMGGCLSDEIKHTLTDHFNANYRLLKPGKKEVLAAASRKRRWGIMAFRISPKLYVWLFEKIAGRKN